MTPRLFAGKCRLHVPYAADDHLLLSPNLEIHQIFPRFFAPSTDGLRPQTRPEANRRTAAALRPTENLLADLTRRFNQRLLEITNAKGGHCMYPPFDHFSIRAESSALGDRVCRACISAGAAGNASRLVDLILRPSFADRAHRARAGAGAAANALVGNLECHKYPSSPPRKS